MCDYPDEIKDKFNNEINEFGKRGIRAIALGRTDNVQQDKDGNCVGWHIAGFLCFLDPPRPDTSHVIRMAEMFGVKVKMITGDAQPIAVEMCKTIGLPQKEEQEEMLAAGKTCPMILTGEEELVELPIENLMEGVCADGTRNNSKKKEDDSVYWNTCTPLGDAYGEVCLDANGFAGVLPEHKFLIVEALRQMGHLVGMCGDGVNDAPALPVPMSVSLSKAQPQQLVPPLISC